MCVAGGLTAVSSGLVGLLVAAAVLLVTRVDIAPDPGWDRRHHDRRHGARGDVQDLAWAMVARDGRVGERVLRQLRDVARSRLARHGRTLDDADVEHLLGTRAAPDADPHTLAPADRRRRAAHPGRARPPRTEAHPDRRRWEPPVMTEQPPTTLTVAQVADRGSAVLDEVATLVVGMREPLTVALAAILGGGHVLFEDVPGLGKTLAARSLATALGLEFRRVQCTPDLLPSDITGSSIFDPATASFAFRPGPVFAGLLLADEINRTAPKTQSALLEAMAERQVTVDGETYRLPDPFHVVATSNPVEYEGTYPLPEAQLDRFMVRVAVGYPERDAEVDVLSRRLARRQEMGTVRTVVDAATLRAMQAGVEAVTVDTDILRYCVDLAAATRAHDAVEVGASRAGRRRWCWSRGRSRCCPGGTS